MTGLDIILELIRIWYAWMGPEDPGDEREARASLDAWRAARRRR